MKHPNAARRCLPGGDAQARIAPPCAGALERLLSEVRRCTICAAHLPQAPRPVLQAGSTARVLIAGQAPGRRVDRSGIPFDDPSGDRLRGWMGVDTETFYDPSTIALLPMGFCYPGTGTSGDLPPRPECAATWRTPLLDQMPHVELILVIGRYAQAWHLKQAARATLTETVRAWREHGPRLVPLPHPSPRNNLWLRRNPWFELEVLPPLRERVAALTVRARP
jgi:uracil-DNA glycosylase